MRKTAKEKGPQVNEVDAYISGLPADEKAALEKLRQVIKKSAPEARELISYRIPSYKYHGLLVGFAAFPKHLSFITMRPELVSRHAAELKGYEYSGSTIHFTPEKPLPAALVTKLIKERMAENEKNGKK